MKKKTGKKVIREKPSLPKKSIASPSSDNQTEINIANPIMPRQEVIATPIDIQKKKFPSEDNSLPEYSGFVWWSLRLGSVAFILLIVATYFLPRFNLYPPTQFAIEDVAGILAFLLLIFLFIMSILSLSRYRKKIFAILVLTITVGMILSSLTAMILQMKAISNHEQSGNSKEAGKQVDTSLRCFEDFATHNWGGYSALEQANLLYDGVSVVATTKTWNALSDAQKQEMLNTVLTKACRDACGKAGMSYTGKNSCNLAWRPPNTVVRSSDFLTCTCI